MSWWGSRPAGTMAGRCPISSLHGFDVPVTPLQSPGFAFRDGRSIDLAATLWTTLRRAPGLPAAACDDCGALVDETRPDLVINFFEPLTGLLQLLRPLPVPVVAVAHQHMIDHPAYVRRPGGAIDRMGLALFAGLVGRPLLEARAVAHARRGPPRPAPAGRSAAPPARSCST